MTTYEKIVKGATKVKVAAPKLKYIEPILIATLVHHETELDNFHTVMKTLQYRLLDSAWSVVYKLLIVIHIMIREGDRDFTLKYIGENMPNLLNLEQSSVSRSTGYNNDVKFILKYAKYLLTRVKQFQATQVDYVRDERSNNSTDQAGGRLRFLSVDKGLLRESESVQKQIDALLKNNFMENDIKNDILLTCFRLLVNDLLSLFQELNEGVINILEHYFEMSKVDAERALKIYKKFVDQTKYVIDYLRVAKHLEHSTKLHVPTIKHAPTALTSSLEEYLDDPNFEINRRQYLNEKNDKVVKKTPSVAQPSQSSQAPAFVSNGVNATSGTIATTNAQRPPSLIVQQSTYNPWDHQILQQPFVTSVMPVQETQMNPAITGNGFGGYGPQISNPFVQQLQAQQTMQQPVQQPFQQPVQQPLQQQPFQQQPVQVQMTSTQPFQPQITSTQPFQPQITSTQTFGLQRSNTNPFSSINNRLEVQSTNPFTNSRFAANSNTTAFSEPKAALIQANSTGSNPFKVSNATTSLFNSVVTKASQPEIRRQPTAGGLENLPTIPVFPQLQQEHQKQQYLNQARSELQSTGQFPITQNPTQYQVTGAFTPQPQVSTGTGYNQQVQSTDPFGNVFGQPLQQPLYANNTYNGPSLI